ncbi:MAG: tRNA (guanosine(37)-N1)-methyltransferase TrmD [Marinagarivorans sp.]|nr:tRNA (guanosine(37)-N1)-methyltransferase TrmD [Marinagarivorans sp.]
MDENAECTDGNNTLYVGVITLFPEMFQAITEYGVTRKAVGNNIVSVGFFNPRDFTTDKHRTVDDRPYGGGPGMLMMAEPLAKAVAAAKAWQVTANGQAGTVIYLSPQGKTLDQQGVQTLSKLGNLVLVAGRYEGVDERFITACVDQEWSVGDYIVSGGELPAMVLLDAVMRLLPGVLGDATSASQDSFEYGLLDCPHYTRPEIIAGEGVPEALLSGDHQRIAQWRLQQSLGRTQARRPDLLRDIELDGVQQALLNEYRKGLKFDKH